MNKKNMYTVGNRKCK